MKIKTAELTGAALDWAEAHASKREYLIQRSAIDDEMHVYLKNGNRIEMMWSPSTSWLQSGPIIEQKRINTTYVVAGEHIGQWCASYGISKPRFFGPTPLVAAMRCFVASKLGDEVDVPEELLERSSAGPTN